MIFFSENIISRFLREKKYAKTRKKKDCFLWERKRFFFFFLLSFFNEYGFTSSPHFAEILAAFRDAPSTTGKYCVLLESF